MKKQIQIAFATAGLVLLSGCAGQNNTLFMTKSNAGLDFDAKPPTAEITISRKEAVIAPAFEGGQTPPVMASFKPKTGMGGFNNFFVGVDQTFAGGDAAMAMAMLYDSATPPDTEPISKYDSKVELTKPPKHKDVFRGLAKPGEVRPFIFGTDTMLGLKVAWSGAGGQVPDTVKMGFNRKEFAWAPVTLTHNPGSKTHPHAVRMPSFLATIESKIESNTNSGISAMQYFATGKAATHLAVQRDVRAAMLYRLDPHQEKLKTLGLIHTAEGPVGLRVGIVVSQIYDGLGAMRDSGDKQAELHLVSLEALGKLAPARGSLAIYHRASDGIMVAAPLELTLGADGTPDFSTFVEYRDALRGSIQTLTNALGEASFKLRVPGATDAETIGKDSPRRADLKAVMELQRNQFSGLASRVQRDAATAAAVRYYCDQLTH